jgi:hypothetical protein
MITWTGVVLILDQFLKNDYMDWCGSDTYPRPAVFNSLETVGAVEILSMIGYEN